MFKDREVIVVMPVYNATLISLEVGDKNDEYLKYGT